MFSAVEMGERIRMLRLARHMTQEQLAHKLGLSVSFVGHIERGTRQPSMETLVMLSETFAVTSDYLLLGDQAVRISKHQVNMLQDIAASLNDNSWIKGLNLEGIKGNER